MYYLINGTVKNTANELLEGVSINVICYDVNGIELFDTDVPYTSCYDKSGVGRLPQGYSGDFEIKIYRIGMGDHCSTYFDDVESFDFVISTA